MKKKFLPFHLDPRTKIFVMLVICAVATMVYQGLYERLRPWYLLLPFLLLALDKRPFDALKFGMVYALTFFYDKWMFFLPESGAARNIVRLIAGIIIVMLPFFTMGNYIIRTTKVSEFIAAMQNMRISPKIVIPFAVLFRFFPTISEEYASIRDAMRMRGISMGSGPVAVLEYRLVPLMISLVKIGDDLSAAASTRGMSADGARTNHCNLYWSAWDIIIFLMSAVMFAIFFLSAAGVL